jgi:hypothetical protein
MKKLTFEQSWIFYLTKAWKNWDIKTLVHFQLYQEFLCVGLAEFKRGCTKYKIQYDFKYKDSFKQQIARKIFLRKTGLGKPEMEDFEIPKRVFLLLEKDATTASVLCNLINMREYEENKTV